MGDVFNAMQRAKQEAAQAATAASADTDAATVSPVLPEGENERLAIEYDKGKNSSQYQADIGAVVDRTDERYSPDVVVHHDRGSVITEQYRAIRTQILARARSRRLQAHVITSAASKEGKSVSAANLAMAFGELRNQKTVLLEGDLRRPVFERMFGMRDQPGLLAYLRGQVDDVQAIIRPSSYRNLQIIPAGDREFIKSTELLSSPRMAQLLEHLRERYDHVFIDSPPVLTVTDACILGTMADQTLLVVRMNHTPTEEVERAKRLLRAANCDVAGCILTHMNVHVPNYLYRYV